METIKELEIALSRIKDKEEELTEDEMICLLLAQIVTRFEREEIGYRRVADFQS
ncbi:hypothetical protein KJ693_06390 [bacterium]|nr:hypothetical protein [bacterium]MBU1614928.1 hypothetical protein [bacterium]